jgi:glycosyltransferase involved in cell wall biosynthesis
MKIAVVYQYAYPDSLGGGERRLFEIFSRFDQAVDWYCQQGVGSSGNINYYPLSTLNLKKRSFFETIAWVFLMIKIPISKYDIVHIGQMPFFHIITLILKRKILCLIGKKTPIFVIDWWEYWGEYWTNLRFPISFFGRVSEFFLLKNVENFITISQKTTQDIAGLTNGKIKQIHNGVNIDMINTVKKSVKNSSDFIYFGRLERHKNVEFSIEVFSKLVKLNPKYKFNIIGDGPDFYRLKMIVKSLKLERNIKMHGRVESDKKLYSIVSASKCMLFFGTQEGGGSISLFEANACGIPIAHVLTENGIDRDLITSDTGFLFHKFDSDQISLVLHKFLINIEEQANMKISCKKFVQGKSWGEISHQYKTYYNNLNRE